MGDKSPKSKQKNESQKQGKANASAKEKKRVIESKRSIAPSSPSKK